MRAVACGFLFRLVGTSSSEGEGDGEAARDARDIRRRLVMTRVLLVGQEPETVDYSDPALPPGMDAKKIQAGIDLCLKQMADRGWQADVCMVQPDATAGPAVERQLAAAMYDCVVIGAGLRLPPKMLLLFETVVNTVHKAAPNTAIAFNTVPQDSADAAARWLPAGHT